MAGISMAVARPLLAIDANGPTMAYFSMEAFLSAPRTSAGLAPLGQYAVQSPQLWHSHTSGSAAILSLRPHCAQTISFLGNAPASGDMLQTTEQVAHW